MKMTVNEALGVNDIFKAAGPQATTINARTKIAIAILGLSPVVTSYYEKRNEVLSKLGSQKGDKFEFAEGREEEFIQENKVMLGEEVDVEIKPIPASHLDGVESVDFDTLVALMNLGVVVE